MPDNKLLSAFDALEKALVEAGLINQDYRHAAVALSAVKSLLLSAIEGEAA
jgi:hypothetical protein